MAAGDSTSAGASTRQPISPAAASTTSASRERATGEGYVRPRPATAGPLLVTAVDQAEPDQLGERLDHVGGAETGEQRPRLVAPDPHPLDQRHRVGGGQRLGDLGDLPAAPG